MSNKDDAIIRWQDEFRAIAEKHAENLLKTAKAHSTTYREASKFIKRVEDRAFNDITDPADRAGWQITEAVCIFALHKLHEEERDMPIKKGAEQ